MENIDHFTRSRPWLLLFIAVCVTSLLSGCSRSAQKERHLARGQSFFKAEQYDKAEIEFLNVLRLEHTNAVAMRHLGLSYHQQGKLLRAYAFLQKSAELEPRNDEVRLRFAGILVASQKLKEAREHAESVLSRDPANEEAIMLLADTVTSLEDIQTVRQRIESARPYAENKAGFHLALGALGLRQQHTNDALAHFQRGLLLDARSSPAHFALGNIFSLLKDDAKADFHFKTAAELAPVRSARRIQYADFKLRNGDVAAAKNFLESMTKQAPDYLPAYTRLAEIALAERRFDEAASLSKKILAHDTANYDAMLLLGRVSLARGEPSKALADFERIVKAYPRVPQAHHQLALAQLMNKNEVKAVSSLRQALVFDPKHTESILVLAELNIRKNDLNPAVFALKELIKDQPQVAQAHLLLATAYRGQRELHAAAGVYENMTQIFPRSPQSHFLWGQILLLQKKKDEARKKFERALEISPDFLLALEELVDLDIADSHFSAAEKRVQNHITRDPKTPALLLFLAKIHSAQKDYTKAEDALSRAIALDANHQAAYLALARVYVASNKYHQAIEKLNAILAKSSQDVAALMLKSMIHTELKDYPAAAESYETLLVANPRFIPALNNLAYIYSEHLNQFDKAYTMARSARDLQPLNPLVADTLGWILFKRGEYPAALGLLQESADKLPRNPEVFFHLGMTHYMLGEEQPARLALERALQSDQNFTSKAEAQQKLAFLSSPAGPNTAAALERQLAANPRDPIVASRLASLYEQSGAADKAVKTYNQMLQYDPRSVSAMVKVAQLYAGPLRDQPKAMQVAREARELAPEDPHVSHILGRLAFQAADYKWSLSLLQESSRKISGQPELLYDLAWAWYSLGRLSEADFTMKRAAAAGESFGKLADAKRFLEMNAVYLQADKRQAAAPLINAALEQDSTYVPALFASALVQESSGNATAARVLYQKVLNQFPAFAPAHKHLARLLAESAADTAYSHAVKAREALPDDPEVARTLGILALHRQEYIQSAQLLKEISRKYPNDAECFYYLGIALFHLKEKNESRQALQQALNLATNAPFAADARRALADVK